MAISSLNIDTGIQEFQINGGGILRFNPSDPNVFNRFFSVMKDIEEIDKDFTERAGDLQEGDGEGALRLISETDSKIKSVLNDVFGNGNDFNEILCGVNVMAAGSNGKRVITNLFDALTPIFSEGAKKCADAKLQSIKANREQRKVAAKG